MQADHQTLKNNTGPSPVVARRRSRWIAIGGMAVLAIAGSIGGFFAFYYEPGADRSYDTNVQSPVLMRKHPRVLFDSGHQNIHSIHGRYHPFAALIESDGGHVSAISKKFAIDSLKEADILVVVNAKSPTTDRTASAFDPGECDAVRDWVRGGGALLLVADHHPFGECASKLAERFGVEMSGGWTDDKHHSRQRSGDDGQLLFSRSEGLLGKHPITEGVNTVETFTGQSLKGPPGATGLLLLGDTAMDRVPITSESKQQGSQTITTFQTNDRSAKGRCQGLAMHFGKGRVVVLGEAAMLTAQIDNKTGRKFGMNAPDNDDRAFTLNVVRWLAGALGE